MGPIRTHQAQEAIARPIPKIYHKSSPREPGHQVSSKITRSRSIPRRWLCRIHIVSCLSEFISCRVSQNSYRVLSGSILFAKARGIRTCCISNTKGLLLLDTIQNGRTISERKLENKTVLNCIGYLVDPASSYMLVLKIKPCMCKSSLQWATIGT
jgi:hypothetical protein